MVNRLLNPNDSSTFGKSLSLRVDGAIGAMSLSPNGRDAVLAGRRGLFIIDMDDPFTPPRWLHHITSWEVADVQWSPHSLIKPSWCISTSNQKALLWDLSRPSNNAIANILHAHTRAISDINFHPSDPEILATCSIDTFALSWDMRAPRKPANKWADWRAGAIQVKWNHENPYEIASSHDNSFYVWDTRKGALPVVKVSKAHEGKINGLDFTQGLKNVITCSNDNQIKFWDLSSGKSQKAISEFNYFSNSSDDAFKASVVIETDFPISRARTLPFGTDKAVGVMPLRDGQDSIHIINYEDAYKQYLATNETQTISGEFAYSFKGHRGPIKDFLWRTKHEKYKYFESKQNWKDYQLVTWSDKDVDLKLWPSDEKIYKSVNYNPTFLNVFREVQDGELSTERTPSEEELQTYETFCREPEVTIDDVAKTNGGDILSAVTLYQIAEKRKQSGYEFSQLDHLDWISGVRIGHTSRVERKDSSTSIENEGPSNLGEEVSIVGHKFPFIRFEKISVSTGELVISLKGPTVTPEVPLEKKSSVDSMEIGYLDTVNSTKDKSVLSEDGKELDRKSFTDGSIKNANIDEIMEEPIEQKLIFIRLAIDFPLSYPYLEEVDVSKGTSSKRVQKLIKQNEIKFEIEETHELSKEMKTLMENTLNEIANFYANKYQRFCLEPCLRYLLGEKIELDDDLMIEHRRGSAEDEYLPEVGNEGWVDDLINQQPDFNGYSSGEDNDPGYGDLIPALPNVPADAEIIGQDLIEAGSNVEQKPPNFDSTPIPKGCGAVWSPTGKLVCFFIPKANSEIDQENIETQKINILKFNDNGFSVKTHHSPHQNHDSTISSDSESENSDSDDLKDDSDAQENENSSSDEDFEDDLEELLKQDSSVRNRMPGLLRSSFGLGSRFVNNDDSHKSSLKKLTSHGESLSNYKSSLKGDKKKSNGKNKNIVGIIDFSHLLPDRLDLAKEYKVIGDSPENLAAFNSKVAFKHDLKEIGEVWKILEILLNNSAAGGINPNIPSQLNHIKGKNLSMWGSHPFGYTWLIQEIFEYFIKQQNTQMLAMMSCLLHQSPHILRHTRSFELLYSTQDQFDRRSRNTDGSTINDEKSEITYNDSHSIESSYRRKESRINNYYNHSINSSTDNLSSRTDSPDKFSYMKKFGPPLNSLNTKNHSQGSLIEPEIKTPTPKKVSKGITEKTRLNRKFVATKLKVDPPPEVTFELQNVEELDIFEESIPNNLPDCLSDEKMKMYRSMYAETLYDWNLPVKRLEILKFNYENETKSESIFSTHVCKIGLRKRNKQTPNQIFINTVSSVIMRKPNAWNTNKRQLIKYCTLCNLAATKNFTLCGNCEHILHTDCASEWWSEENQECASGCGCNCLQQSIYH
ncbi:uncharacterized protein KGF55_000172 [Candida pseudojiufengensis]|uniref:uncharacterized protein n=1 Tax=Candida pseudojiufengensis TaxID=497109 RepID=UPI002224A165|nr:uncharacterized protein KGF55_000172 [Candida pseudojiufengensis]KAI5966763.1 hypothetical protein KGF55_000172 [Candida pseudojiufengensis]